MGESSVSRRSFLGGCAASVPALISATGCQTHGASTKMPECGEFARAKLGVKDPSRFRILQLTDLHYFDKMGVPSHEGTHELVNALLEKTGPDLVMITGDLWLNNDDGAGHEHMGYAIAQFESWGVPWAFTWGNHDQMTDYAVGHKAFASARNSLYRGAETGGNYAIDVVSPEHRRVLQLVCLNSRQEGLGEEQWAWLRDLAQADAELVPRLAFFHIPLKQYADVWNAGNASGFKGEEVCNEKEEGGTLPLLMTLGVKACFCGHDHVNDYSGTVDGVELAYGRAAGGYGAERLEKGGKVIDFDSETSTYRWFSVTRTHGQWRPDPGTRLGLK